MREKINEIFSASCFFRWIKRASAGVSRFFASSAIGAWFQNENITHKPLADRLAERLLNSRFCDFWRSSVLLGALMKIPNIAWVFLKLTALGAMCLPTLAVMLLSMMTLALTVISLIFRKEKLRGLSNGILFWAIWFLITLFYMFVNFGGIRGLLSAGIRLAMLPLLPCALILLQTRKRRMHSALVLTAGSLAVGLYGLYQYFSGQMDAKWTDIDLFSVATGRLTATFENPNVYGTFLLLAIPVTLVLACCAKGWRSRCFFGVTTAVLVINMLLTYSRGCYVALVISLIFLLRRKDKRWLAPVAVALLLCPLYLPAGVSERILSIGNMADTSTAYRFSIWSSCLAMLGRYWWIGIGIGDASFHNVYSQYAPTSVTDVPHAHNLLLQTLCESGVIGALTLSLMLIFLFRRAESTVRREPSGTLRWVRLALIVAWVGLLVQGVTDYIFYNNNLFAVMMISLGVMICPPEGESYE